MTTRHSLHAIGTSEKGFTIVEMLIVLAIIGILSTITVVNLRPSSNKAAFELGAREIVTILNDVQQQARNQTLYSFDGGATQKVPDHFAITLRNRDLRSTTIGIVACLNQECKKSVSISTTVVDQILLHGGPGTQKDLRIYPPHGTIGADGSDKVRVDSPSDPTQTKMILLSGNGRVTIY